MSDWGSRTAKVREFFGEAPFEFQLQTGELTELQDITKAGPQFLMSRIDSGQSATWLQDVKHTLRLGLVGAGMLKEEAYALVERHVKSGYLLRCSTVAVKVLAASYVGVEEEREKLGEPEGEDASPSPTDKSGSQTSTEPPPPPASAPPKRTRRRSGN